jgi:hypothetical protein
VAPVNPALDKFNQRNREFWSHQKTLMDRRMADRALLETAIETINSETARRVAIRSQKIFEDALQDAERAKQRFSRQQAQLGGFAPKTNGLEKIIADVVRQNPKISVVQLLMELRMQQGDGIIDEIDETHIYFRQNGTAERPEGGDAVGKRVISASAPISGLKHRLTRARKKVSRQDRSR